jgi:hypothetical protein
MAEQRFFKALFKTVLFFAFFHLILLVVLAVVNARLTFLNVFEIVGLQHFFPGIENGALSFMVSLFVIGVVYFFFYRRHKNKN